MSDTASEPSGFFGRYLDPGERLAEIVFGLVMVLTITLTAGLTMGFEPGAAREMLIAAIGCNIAWGIIDGGMYIMGALLGRGRKARLIAAIRRAPDEAAALAAIGRALDATPAGSAPGDERRRFYRSLREIALRTTPETVRITRDDMMGALATCMLVVLVTVPAAVPFALMDDARSALRVSNGLLLGLLFGSGYAWGHHSGVNRWMSGVVFLAVGTVLVVVAVLLGG